MMGVLTPNDRPLCPESWLVSLLREVVGFGFIGGVTGAGLGCQFGPWWRRCPGCGGCGPVPWPVRPDHLTATATCYPGTDLTLHYRVKTGT